MKINVKTFELKTLDDLDVGEVFEHNDSYFIKTNIRPYDNDDEIHCIDLKTGKSNLFELDTPITPVRAEITIFYNKGE